MSIDDWLQSIGLGAYAEAFRQHAVDPTLLASLTDEDLREIGVQRVGDRRRLALAIAELGGNAAAAPSTGAASDPARDRPPIGAMIGRTHERAILMERWALARTGEGQVVVLSGDPGIGKSRLVRDLVEHVAGYPHAMIAYRCWPDFSASPFHPAIRQLELAAGFKAGDEAETRRAKLHQALAEVALAAPHLETLEALMSISRDEGTAATPDRLHMRAVGALVDRLVATAADRPVLFVVEDVHWADPSTLELLGAVVARAAPLPILVVATHRAQFTTPWAQQSQVALIKLSNLSRSQAASMIGGVLEGRRLPDGLMEEILRKTDGVPLFIEQVMQTILESGSLVERGGRYEVVDDRVAVSVPETLHDTLLSRLDRDEAARALAQAASAFGREFTLPVLAVVMGEAEPALRQTLQRLLDASLIVRQPSRMLERYAFKHGLLQEAIYGTLLVRSRQDLHRRIAEAIERMAPEIAATRPELLARHYGESGHLGEAVSRWAEAGQRATRRGSYGEARQHIAEGLRLVGAAEDDDDRARLELPLQMVLVETLRSARFTGGDEARAACQRARLLCRRLGERKALIKLFRLEFGIAFNRPDYEAAMAVARDCLALAASDGDALAQALGETFAGCLAFFAGRLDDAAAHLGQALNASPAATAQELADLQYPSGPLTYLAWTEVLRGRSDIGWDHLTKAIEVSADQSTFTLSLTLANALLICQCARDAERLKGISDRLAPLARERDIPYWRDLAEYHRGYRLALDGEIAAGLPLMAQAIETFQANAVEIEIPFYLAHYAEWLAAAGATAEAQDLLDDARQRIQRTAEFWCLAEVERLLARLMRPSDPDQADRLLAKALDLAERQGAVLWRDRILADQATLGPPARNAGE